MEKGAFKGLGGASVVEKKKAQGLDEFTSASSGMVGLEQLSPVRLTLVGFCPVSVLPNAQTGKGLVAGTVTMPCT